MPKIRPKGLPSVAKFFIFFNFTVKYVGYVVVGWSSIRLSEERV
jgi:hypothetical protein